MRLAGARCFLLDLDGTTYVGDRLVDGALNLIRVLEATGRRYLYVTNNDSKSSAEYVERLTGLGLPVTPEDVLTAGEATCLHLSRHFPGQRVHLVGTPSLEQEFRDHGIVLVEGAADPDVCVLAFDTTLTYGKLRRLCELVRAGMPYLATHADFNCPTPTGPMPDTGSTIALVRASTGRDPDLVIGKPNRFMAEAAAAKAGVPLASLAMVGDRLYTDIAMGRTAGVTTVLVLSGETSAADLAAAPHRPDHVFEDVGALADWLSTGSP